jgi:hypothetical protein
MQGNRRPRSASLIAALILGALAGAPSAQAQTLSRSRARLERQFADLSRQVLQRRLSLPEARRMGDELERSLHRILEIYPESEALRALYCEHVVALAFAFKEEEDSETAARLYQAAQRRSGEALERAHPKAWLALSSGSPDLAQAALASLRPEDSEMLFWYAFSAGLEVDLLRTSRHIAQIPRLKALLTWLVEQRPKIFYGGPHLALGLLYSVLPPAAGQDLSAARRHFDAVESITEGRFLIASIIRARSYSVALQGQAGPGPEARRQAAEAAWRDFFDVLERAALSPENLDPDARLYNLIARERAWRMLAAAEDFILLPPGTRNPYARSSSD